MTSLTVKLLTVRSLVAIVILFVVFLATLAWLGRIPYCECGFGLWTPDAFGNENSQMFTDPYSFSHILHGILFFGLLWFFRKRLTLDLRLIVAVALEIGWEILENTSLIIDRYREGTAAQDYVGDSILNSSGDVLFAMLGFWIASRFSWRVSVAAVIAIELIMLYFIRDNLTLNILMLIAPVPVIRSWQMGI